jgi:tetratricopeptide (TPR) repeat protein
MFGKFKGLSICVVVLLSACDEADQEVSANEKANIKQDAVMVKVPDFDKEWNYDDPVKTREKFLSFLTSYQAKASKSWSLELQTQIARTHSLSREFPASHKILDEVEPLIGEDMQRVRVRYLLERGRTYNSADKKEIARPLFVEAFVTAKDEGEDFLAVDAAHMVAIVEGGSPDGVQWNLKALNLARSSSEEKARGWIGSLTNNMGWDAFDGKRLDEALSLFEESRDHFLSRDQEGRARIARWAIARVKREQGALSDALALQLELKAEYDATGTKDGYVFEELGEIYLSQGDASTAKPNFARAYEILSSDDWLMENEAARMDRIKELGSPN